MRKRRTISRDAYKALLDAGRKLTRASLYEPDHATDGSEFLFVEFGPQNIVLCRLHPASTRK